MGVYSGVWVNSKTTGKKGCYAGKGLVTGIIYSIKPILLYLSFSGY
jgi:hypothetical protein